ncbi:unnamed protein product [Ectocarpus sp. 12 AP-2014]
MGNCLPCLHEKKVDRRSARSSYFDAKSSEKKAMTYTSSEFGKENRKLGISIKYKVPPPKKAAG